MTFAAFSKRAAGYNRDMSLDICKRVNDAYLEEYGTHAIIFA